MNRDYITHWIIGIGCLVIWAMGEKFGLPADLVQLAKITIPGILAHALNYSPETPSPNVQAPSGAQSVDHQPV